MRYLELNSDGRVVNAIEWDGVSPYSPPGITLMPHSECPNAWIGWCLIDGEWAAPEVLNSDEGSDE